MIKSFADKETELVYNQRFSKKLPPTIQKAALRKLMMIDNAKTLEDLRVPPANRLEQLSGDRAGQHSIRINNQWRVCFTEKGGHFYSRGGFNTPTLCVVMKGIKPDSNTL